MGRSLSGAAQGGREIKTSNGYARRKIILTSGAYNFTLPNDANECEIAVFGGGGGGALKANQNGTQPHICPGGGAGGGFSRRRFTGVNGATVTGTVGAAGAGGSYAVPSNNSAGVAAGGNGGTTTATLNGVTISATGGAGAPPPASAQTPAAGGIGAGGDINANGGLGGPGEYIPSSYNAQQYHFVPGGGGASGSHRGNGGNGGGSAPYASGIANADSVPGTGGGWGGDGLRGLYQGGTGSRVHSGGGSAGPGRSIAYTAASGQNAFMASLFPGMGTAPFAPLAAYGWYNGGSYGIEIKVPLIEDWWDITDIRGWSGGLIQVSNSSIQAWPAGPGAGGGHVSHNNSFAAGFGGGGVGVPYLIESNVLIPTAGVGGVGGGGGGRNIDLTNQNPQLANQTVSAPSGGPGCVIIWY